MAEEAIEHADLVVEGEGEEVILDDNVAKA